MLTSILRTFIPWIWGAFIGWVLSVVPVLEPLREELLSKGDAAVPIIGLIITAAWYVLWRKVEPYLPDWLTRILLGSAKTPVYEPLAILESQLYDGELTADYHDADRPKHSTDE